MAVSHEIQYFLGANSPTGFYSLYSELLPLRQPASSTSSRAGLGAASPP